MLSLNGMKAAKPTQAFGVDASQTDLPHRAPA
jgi:hypothetical protein